MQAQGIEGAQEEHRRRSDVTQVLYKCCTDVAQLLQRCCPGVEQVLHGVMHTWRFCGANVAFGATPLMQRRCGGVGAWVAHYVVGRWSEDGA